MAKVIRGAARVVPGAVVDAKREAEEILERARVEAESLREAGREALEAEAREAARAGLAAAMVGVETARREAIEEVRASVAELALALARRIVADALADDPSRIEALVQDALSRVRRASRTRVRVHPDGAGRLGALDVEVIADETLEPGDCVVESDLGDVDARIETRLDALERALRDASGS